MDELVSVLMSVYNTPAGYLTEAVESILNQSYKNVEFIIVNDGSNNADICDYLKKLEQTDNRVKLICNERNIGLTKSLNIGLKLCRGKYIARMDSDDASMTDRIRKEVEYLDSHPEVALVGSNIICFGTGQEDNDVSETYNKLDDPEIYRISSLLHHSGPPHPTFMFKGSFLTEKGIEYREDILKAQDYGIMADVLMAGGKISKIREPLIRYRVHDDQITMRSEKEQKAYQCRVSRDYISYVFSELSYEECAALSLLGCEYSVDEIIEAIEGDAQLRKTCEFVVKLNSILLKPEIYIKAVKRIIEINRVRHLYDKKKFEEVFRSRWWKLAIRTTLFNRRPWGMCFYTIASHRFV